MPWVPNTRKKQRLARFLPLKSKKHDSHSVDYDQTATDHGEVTVKGIIP
jgi:hypothetical protein